MPDDVVVDDGELVHLAFMEGTETLNWQEAITTPKWKAAMQEKINAIERNKTWILFDPHPMKKSISVKWVFKLKLKHEGSIAKHKARLVARGFLRNKE